MPPKASPPTWITPDRNRLKILSACFLLWKVEKQGVAKGRSGLRSRQAGCRQVSSRKLTSFFQVCRKNRLGPHRTTVEMYLTPGPQGRPQLPGQFIPSFITSNQNVSSRHITDGREAGVADGSAHSVASTRQVMPPTCILTWYL